MSKFNEIADQLIPEETKNRKYFKLLCFYRASEICELNEDESDNYVCTRSIDFSDYKLAMDAYANIPCPASQLIEADSHEELAKKVEEMINNYKDEEWLEKNLYPFL